MKKLLILLALPLLFSACLKDDEDKFSKSATERIEAAVKEAITVLQGAENGWRMEMYPEKERIYGGYTLFLKFNADNTVVASGENFGAGKTDKSLYAVKAENGPVLTFDTNNEIIHYFSSPTTGAELGVGTANGGLEGDSDFVVMEASADFVKLKGTKTNNYAYLYPIEPGVNWTTELQAYIDAGDNMSLTYNRCVVGGNTYSIDTETMLNNFTSRAFKIAYTPSAPGEDGSVSTTEVIKAPYICTKTGVKFYSPLTIGNATISEMTFKENYYLESEDGSVKIYSPQPIHSANKLTIGVSDITFSSATISLTPTVASEYYYFDVYEKSEISGMSDIGFIKTRLSELNAKGADDVISNYAQKGAVTYPLEDEFSPETDYVVAGFGIAVSEGVVLGTTQLFKKEFTTAEMPPLDEAYAAWLGTWTVTSDSSEKTNSPVTFDVAIHVKVPNKSYSIKGWSITTMRTSYAGIGNITADGKIAIAGDQTIASLPDGRTFKWICRFKYSGGYNVISGVETALTLTLDAGKNTATGVGYSATHPSLGAWQATTMDFFLFAATGGGYWPYNPAPGFTEDNYPVGPYKLTKKSSSTTAMKARTAGYVERNHSFQRSVMPNLSAVMNTNANAVMLK